MRICGFCNETLSPQEKCDDAMRRICVIAAGTLFVLGLVFIGLSSNPSIHPLTGTIFLSSMVIPITFLCILPVPPPLTED
ncbi:MAG: hypothetical protein S4CHLAM45_05400 [Chlamydiales bacterium]|nr:hypothetical protein [Chlamydiales bacterium]MCH9619919.1 hypothetical protein [Chlamydiales bacterium]MCH9622654.1 hypothetical protein [Chlamydiales bacterium]